MDEYTGPTQEEARAAGMDLMLHDDYRSIRAVGALHRITVMQNENHTGWVVDIQAPSGAANLPQGQAEILARFLLAGPAPDPRPKCEHGKPERDFCRACLVGDDS